MSEYIDIIDKANDLKIGDSFLIEDISIIPDDSSPHLLLQWTQMVRYLEGEGKIVCAITKDIPEGVYIAEGLLDTRMLKGWGLESVSPLSLCIKNIGWAFRSEKPKPPITKEIGLKLVPHYTMGIILGSKKEGWGEVFHIPSGAFSLMIADTSGIQYGQSAFEGACAMRNENEEVFGFRLDQNAHRFIESVESLDISAPCESDILNAIEKTITYNAAYVPAYKEGKLYIRPSVLGLSGGLGVIVPDYFLITIEVAAFGDYLPASIRVEARKDISRPSTGTNKIAPNYGGSYRIKHGVKERGFDDYLSFDKNGNVEEVATCAAGFINDLGEYLFPPVRNEIDTVSRNILPSITRKSTIELLQSLGKTVIIRDIHYSELEKMSCMFTMGNAVGVLYVSEICLKEDDKDIGKSIVFKNERVRDEIYMIKDTLYASRMGDLKGFEHWVKKLG